MKVIDNKELGRHVDSLDVYKKSDFSGCMLDLFAEPYEWGRLTSSLNFKSGVEIHILVLTFEIFFTYFVWIILVWFSVLRKTIIILH